MYYIVGMKFYGFLNFMYLFSFALQFQPLLNSATVSAYPKGYYASMY